MSSTSTGYFGIAATEQEEEMTVEGYVRMPISQNHQQNVADGQARGETVLSNPDWESDESGEGCRDGYAILGACGDGY